MSKDKKVDEHCGCPHAHKSPVEVIKDVVKKAQKKKKYK